MRDAVAERQVEGFRERLVKFIADPKGQAESLREEVAQVKLRALPLLSHTVPAVDLVQENSAGTPTGRWRTTALDMSLIWIRDAAFSLICHIVTG